MKWLWEIFSKLFRRLSGTKTTNNPQEHVDYVLGEFFPGDDSPPISTVKLLTGPYAGVEYCYFNVRVSEHAGSGQLSFKYSFIDAAQFSRDVLKTDRAFITVAGTILESILTREGGMNDTVGTHDPEESSL